MVANARVPVNPPIYDPPSSASSGRCTLKHCALKHRTLKHCALKYRTLKHCALKHRALKHRALKHCALKHRALKHCTLKHCTLKHCAVALILPSLFFNMTLSLSPAFPCMTHHNTSLL